MSQSQGKTRAVQPEQKTNVISSQEKADSSLKKFQDLLRQLFQIEAADLDFGIYRILNYKREQVEEFINKRLPQIVDEAFQAYAKAEKENLQREIERKREEISQAFGEKAFDQQGQLQPGFRETPLGKKYLALQEEMAQYQVTEDLKNRVYNDLYTFFSRYYEDGDFIPKRRYGRRATYAIPYNGEEVVLHWATKDQYYIKTGERFKNYRFKVKISTKDEDSTKVQDYTIAFKLRSATTAQNNNKGEKRYFVLASDKPVALDPEAKTITVSFEYRPLTDAEKKEYGKTEQQKPQDKLNKKAEEAILNELQHLAAREPKNSEEQKELEALKAQLENPEAGNGKSQSEKPEAANGKSLLMKHLDRFTRRNTSDFFIHKNLRGFLRRELDFFIKSECLLLEELLEQKGNLTHQHILRARVVREIGHQIIEFLAQVEDFQKRLFEKKKFVIRTEYCITMDRVPEELWDEVLQNKDQLDEWRQLYGVDPQPTRDFLREHPYLVVDTCHFSEDFKWRLLMHLDDSTKCCLTIDRIPISRVPKALWDEVFQNEAQLAEWRQLHGVDPQPTKEFLREHPTLLVNTHHFSEDFKRRLQEYLDGLTEHCLPIGRVPEELWDEVLQNERQLAEWQQLYGVDPQPTKEFLRQNPTLLVNTHHFSEDFKRRLRECFEGLTDHCLPIGRVPEELWDEVLRNKDQLAEWRQLYGVDLQPKKEVLREHPTLIVDTRHFSKDFKERLREYFEGLTDYCLPIGRVPEELWDEVLQNEAQLAEWQQLYGVDPQPTKEFLRQNPTLIVDTRHFSKDFKERLREYFEGLTDYCLPIGRVPEELWGEVLQNEAQLAEWQQLYGVDLQPKKEVLREHPTLIVDTRHFSKDFKERLREYFEGLTDYCLPIGRVPEELWDEVLRNKDQLAEWQQLYGVDPQPTKEFLRKHPKLVVATRHFSKDFKERLMKHLDGSDKGFDLDEALDGLLIKSENFQALNLLLERYRGQVKCIYIDPPYNTGSDEFIYKDLYRHSSWLSMMADRLELAKQLMADDGSIYVQVDWNEDSRLSQLMNMIFGEQQFRNRIIWYYTNKIPDTRKRLFTNSTDYLLFYAKTEMNQFIPLTEPREVPIKVSKMRKEKGKKIYEKDEQGRGIYIERTERVMDNVWQIPLLHAHPEMVHFHTQKPEEIVRRVFASSTRERELVLDFFLGSGTAASVATKMHRKWIGIEMGDFFETITLRRIKRVIAGEKTGISQSVSWQGGGFFKYLYLEQYEDTLNNLELTRKEEGQLALERFGNEYLLRYMLDFETQGSPSLLNLEQFQDPFNYKLKVQEGDEIREQVVDLVETFNYLLGIHVKKMRQFQDNGRLYRAVLSEKHGKRIVIVWRSLKGLLCDSTDVQRAQGSSGDPGDAQRDKDSKGDTPALRRDRRFIECIVLPALLGKGKKPDRLLVNGICYVPGAESIETEFKRLMWRENQDGWEV